MKNCWFLGANYHKKNLIIALNSIIQMSDEKKEIKGLDEVFSY